MQIDMDMTGTIKGEATYEAATGILIKTSSVSDIKGTMGVMGQSAPMTMSMTESATAKKL
jgi:hypothetical protein